jgi:hypothetical protein
MHTSTCVRLVDVWANEALPPGDTDSVRHQGAPGLLQHMLHIRGTDTPYLQVAPFVATLDGCLAGCAAAAAAAATVLSDRLQSTCPGSCGRHQDQLQRR